MRWKSSRKWGYITTQLHSCLNVWKKEDKAADRELRHLKQVYEGRTPDPFTRKFGTDSDWDSSCLETSLYTRMIREKIRSYLAFRETFQKPELCIDIPPQSAEGADQPHMNPDDGTDEKCEDKKEKNKTKSKNRRNNDRKKRNSKLNKKNQWLLTFLQTFPLLDWDIEFGPPTPPRIRQFSRLRSSMLTWMLYEATIQHRYLSYYLYAITVLTQIHVYRLRIRQFFWISHRIDHMPNSTILYKWSGITHNQLVRRITIFGHAEGRCLSKQSA